MILIMFGARLRMLRVSAMLVVDVGITFGAVTPSY